MIYQIMLSAQNISKSFSTDVIKQDVLKNVSLNIHPGEFITIRGPSGSGKSTLLNILGGIDTTDSGQVICEGKSLGQMSESEMLQYRRFFVAYIFQFFHLFQRLSVLENILLPALIAGKKNQLIQKRAEKLIEQVGLSHNKNKAVQLLSGGEMQRTCLARALINSPKLILADEPTGNLDSKNSEIVLSCLEDLQEEENTSIVIITHDNSVFVRGKKRYEMCDGVLSCAN